MFSISAGQHSRRHERRGVGGQELWNGIVQRHEQLRHDRHRPILDPAGCTAPAEFDGVRAAQIQLHTFEWPPETAEPHQNFPSVAPAAVRIDPRAEQPAAELVNHIESSPARILLAAESAGRRELLLDLLRGRDIQVKIFDSFSNFIAGSQNLGITVSAAVSGLRLEAPALEILTEAQLFGDRARQERRRRRAERDPAKILKELSDLRIGRRWCTSGGWAATPDSRPWTSPAIPASSCSICRRRQIVCAGAGCPGLTLHRRRSKPRCSINPVASNGKARKAQRIRDVAAEPGPVFAAGRPSGTNAVREAEYRLRGGFPFEETVDQAAAIEQVLGDLKSDKPMDRVICGDVGFGKTAAALRAAFVAVRPANKSPYWCQPPARAATPHTSSTALADWPVRIESYRASSNKEAEGVLAGVAAGTVDIVMPPSGRCRERCVSRIWGWW